MPDTFRDNHDAAPTAGVLIDVDGPQRAPVTSFRRMLKLMLMGVLVFFAVLIPPIIVMIILQTNWMCSTVPVALVAPIPVAAWWIIRSTRQWRRELETRLASADDLDSVLDAMRAEMEHPSHEPVRCVREAAERLHELGLLGCTARVARADLRTAIEPLAIEFEARPLDALDPSFRALYEACNAGASEQVPVAAPRLPAMMGGRLGRQALSVLYALLIAGFAWRTYNPGGSWVGLFFVAALASVVFFGVILPKFRGSYPSRRRGPTLGRQTRVTQRWLLAPGGVILQWAGSLQSTWKVAVADRRRSVAVCAYVHQSRAWLVVIVHDNGVSFRTMNAAEHYLFLRAWLSPLPPPAAEQLSDLIGDAKA